MSKEWVLLLQPEHNEELLLVDDCLLEYQFRKKDEPCRTARARPHYGSPRPASFQERVVVLQVHLFT